MFNMDAILPKHNINFDILIDINHIGNNGEP